eukprot:281696-Prymnesium_polylepis.1
MASQLVDRVGDRPWALVKADEMGRALGRPPISAWEPPSGFVWGHVPSRSRPSTTSSRCCRA